MWGGRFAWLHPLLLTTHPANASQYCTSRFWFWLCHCSTSEGSPLSPTIDETLPVCFNYYHFMSTACVQSLLSIMPILLQSYHALTCSVCVCVCVRACEFGCISVHWNPADSYNNFKNSNFPNRKTTLFQLTANTHISCYLLNVIVQQNWFKFCLMLCPRKKYSYYC